MKRSTITKKKSKRQSDFDREFEAIKPLIKMRSRGMCEATIVAAQYLMKGLGGQNDFDQFCAWHVRHCSKRAVHVHHRKYRRRGGTNAQSNLAHLSQECHDYTHAHGGFGRAANLVGLALSSGQSEDL